MAADRPRCAVCRATVEPGRNVVFRRDGRVQHATCPEVRHARAAVVGRKPDVPSIRAKIVAKLQAGALPCDLPEKVGSGHGGDHVCSACDGPILSAQVEYTCDFDGVTLRLHIGCCGLWQAEALRRGVKRDR